jgi:hypothetical protein
MVGTKTLLKSDKKTTSLDKYAGKWVAFVNEKIVAFGDTLEEVANKIEKMKLRKRAVYFLVPRKDEGPYILVL